MSFNEYMNQIEKKRKKRRLISLVIIFMLLPAITLLLYQPFQFYIKDPLTIKHANADANTYDATQIEQNEAWIDSLTNDSDVDEIKENHPNLYEDTGITYDWNAVRLIDRIPSDATINKRLYRGQLFIPALEMNVPIVEGVSNENLYTGASTMKPNMKLGQGNYALAGHLMPDPNTLFSPLKRAEHGMKIYATDKNYVYVYEIKQIEYVAPTEIQWVEDVEGETLITLVTCGTLDGKSRIIVQGSFVEKLDVNELDTQLYESYIAN